MTFDDGYADVYTRAWPMLPGPLGIPSTLFVATGFVDGAIGHAAVAGRPARRARRKKSPRVGTRSRRWPGPRAGRPGLAHASPHPDFDTISAEEAERRAGPGSKRAHPGGHPGITTDLFAYPRAVVGHEDFVGRHYRWALGGEGPKNVAGETDPLRVQRTPVRGSDGVFFLKRRLAGAAPLEDRLYARLKNRGS